LLGESVARVAILYLTYLNRPSIQVTHTHTHLTETGRDWLTIPKAMERPN